MSTLLAEGGQDALTWVRQLPDGAVSVGTQDRHLVLRASSRLQQRFEDLLDKRKAGELTTEETDEYEAICELDDALSWLNRLARSLVTVT
jgi:hypothetical protein